MRTRVRRERLPDGIDARFRALAAIGSAREMIMVDNPEIAVVGACRDEPQVNGAYTETAASLRGGHPASATPQGAQPVQPRSR